MPEATPRMRLDLIKRKKAVNHRPDLYVPFVNMLGGSSWRRIVALVAWKYGVHPKDILGPSRVLNVCAARHEATWLCYTHLPNMSLPKVARLFNRADHTTARNSVEVMKRKKAGQLLTLFTQDA
jgi:hypothetical protein